MMMMFALVGGLAFVGQAQSCCAGKKGTASTCVAPSEAATKAAAADPSIEKRVNAENGMVCFVRKAVAADGSVAFTDVSFDAAAGKFVNTAPAASCAKPAANTAAASCAKPGAACCAGKAAGTSSTTAVAAPQKITPVKKVSKVVKPVAATSSEK